MNKVAIAAVGLLLSAGAVKAADMHASFKDPIMENALHNWAGLYFGGAVGFGVGDMKETNLETTYPDDTLNVNGAIYGAHLGYNIQRGTIVYGIEGAFYGTGIDEVLNRPAVTAGTYTLEHELEWYGTLAARLGYAQGNTLFYGLGGAAWGKARTAEALVGGAHDFDNVDHKTHMGWTAGAGIEHAFNDRFSARIEYAHVDFGTEKTFGGTNDIDLAIDTIKIGASYKLTGVGAPLN